MTAIPGSSLIWSPILYKISIFILSFCLTLCQSQSTNDVQNTSHTTTTPIREFGCPPPAKISPCICTMHNVYPPNPPPLEVPDFLTKPRIFCNGPEVTQLTINKLLSTLRDFQSSDWLNLDSFYIVQTNLTKLDLTSFTRSTLQFLNISHNPHLHAIQGGDKFTFGNTSNSFQVERLLLSWNNLTDAGAQTTLQQINNLHLRELDLSYNAIQGSQFQSSEFLPGLAGLTKLQYLYLQGNKIQTITGSQFKFNRLLQELNLSENEIEELGENTFLFESPPETSEQFIHTTIFLMKNKLTDKNIHENWKAGSQRSMQLKLEGNNFEYISASKFEKFLQQNPRNVLTFCSFGYCLPENSFRCDSRLKWMVESNNSFAPQVDGLYCTNDLPKDVFTSKKIEEDPTFYNFSCPDARSIDPCTCQPGHLILSCIGRDVTQLKINDAINEIRKAQSISRSKKDDNKITLSFQRFQVMKTEMEQLDLSLLLGQSIEKIVIEKNPKLSKIYVDNSSSENSFNDLKIDAEQLHFRWNRLTDEGLANIFRYFDPESLIMLDLTGNQIRGNKTESPREILKHLSLFKNMRFLRLRCNKIEEIGGGQLKNYGRLLELDLGQNGLKTFGKDALLIDHVEGDFENETLHISFYDNEMTEGGMSPLNGMGSLKRPTKISFYKNKFEYISAGSFKEFLYGNEENQLRFDRNPLHCDDKMVWLKDARRDLESKVLSMYCSPNNAFETVFNTNSIP